MIYFQLMMKQIKNIHLMLHKIKFLKDDNSNKYQILLMILIMF